MKQNLQNTCYFETPEDLTIEDFNDLENGQTLNYKNLVGIAEPLGLAMPTVGSVKQWFMVTVNLPTKECFKLNKTTRRQWQMYKPSEQRKILVRQGYLLNDISDKWEIHYEYTKEVNLHTHALLQSSSNRKDIYIDFIRFFGIKPGNRYAIHITEVPNLQGAKDYLTKKTTKTYQTSPFDATTSEYWNDVIDAGLNPTIRESERK